MSVHNTPHIRDIDERQNKQHRQERQDKQIQSLIREFKSNEMEYQEEIYFLRARVQVLELEIHHLHTNPPQSTSSDPNPVIQPAYLQQLSSVVLGSLEKCILSLLSPLSHRLRLFSAKAKKCEQMVRQMKDCLRARKENQQKEDFGDFKGNNKYKHKFHQKQSEVIDHVPREKTMSDTQLHRQIQLLEGLAEDKKLECTRLLAINAFLFQENNSLKEQRDTQKTSATKTYFLTTEPDHNIRSPSVSNLSATLMVSRPLANRSTAEVLSRSNNKVKLHISRKQINPTSKQRAKSGLPLGEINKELCRVRVRN